MIEYGKSLRMASTPIPGLAIWDLPVHGDKRGWFKENWQREKMVAAGLADFRPIQNNISFNGSTGTTRGIHAEPWDKYVSVATGRIFGAWVDLREGTTFGTAFTAELDPSSAVFVPRGVGNAFQTLEPDTAYVYLVNDHYSPDATYTSINLADESVAIKWPIRLQDAQLSDRDRSHPRISNIRPIPPRKTLVIGAGGQVGRALQEAYRGSNRVEFATRADIDLGEVAQLPSVRRWQDYDVLINAAAYTAVDAAETSQGRATAWKTNVAGVAALARIATEHALTLVHISSDYVFDGTASQPYDEEADLCPLGVYAQTKAAADQLVVNVSKHYVVRTSWVIGEGRNFVRSMLRLAEEGARPTVVDDQVGRLTFASEVAGAIRHLIESRAKYGIYNVTNGGPPTSWADIARKVYSLAGYDASSVTGVSTSEYMSSATTPMAPRPRNTVLNTNKIVASAYRPHDADEALEQFIHAWRIKRSSMET